MQIAFANEPEKARALPHVLSAKPERIARVAMAAAARSRYGILLAVNDGREARAHVLARLEIARRRKSLAEVIALETIDAALLAQAETLDAAGLGLKGLDALEGLVAEEAQP